MDERSERDSAVRGGISLLVFPAISRLLGIAFLFFAARLLGPSSFGRYSTAAAAVALAALFADIGTSPALVRRISAQPDSADEVLTKTLWLSIASGLLMGAVVVMYAHFALSTRTRDDILLASLAIPATSVLTSLLAAVDGTGQISRRAAINLVQGATVTGGGAAALAMGLSVRAAISMIVLAPILGMALAAVALARSGVWSGRLRLDLKAGVQLLRDAAPFAVGGATTALILRFDIVALTALRTPADVATYDVAQRSVESLGFLSAAVSGPSLVLLSRRLLTGDDAGVRRAFEAACRFSYLMGLPLSVIIPLGSAALVDLVAGQEFAEARRSLAVLGVGVVVLFITNVQVVLISAGTHLRRALPLALLIVVLVIALDLALISEFGPTGAAVAMVATWVATAVSYDAFNRRTVGLPTPLPSWRSIAAAAICAGPFALPIHDIWAIVAAATVYVTMLLVLGEVRMHEVRTAMRAVTSR